MFLGPFLLNPTGPLDENIWKKLLSGQMFNSKIKHLICFYVMDIVNNTADLVSFFALTSRKLRVKLWSISSKCRGLLWQAFLY